MTTALRPLWSIVFAALLALSLVVSTLDALAYTTSDQSGDGILMDKGYGDRGKGFYQPQGWGRFGVTWE